MSERRPLDPTAFSLMLLLTALWRLQQVSVKLIIADVSPVMQGAIRSKLGIAAAVLPVASVLMGEAGVAAVTPLVVASLAYQGVVVAFASFLAWFWLLRNYLAAGLSVMSSLTPMFGVAFGALILSEPLSGDFVAAALLVAAGIALVNLRR